MSAQAPLVSICIANFNGMDVIDDCLRSIREQFGGISVEIVVHDDASSDASVAHIRTHYPQVQLIASQTNVGFCVANNRMAERARGRYLLLLNNDAALFPDALQAFVSEAQRLQEIGRSAILTLPQFDAASGTLVDRGCLLDPFFNPVPNLDPGRSDVAMVIGACLWIPKDLWQELEGFPEWFGSIAEDMYLCCRARLAGHAVRALDVSGYRHWQGKSFGGGKVVGKQLATTVRRRQLSERNKTFVMVASFPFPLFQLMFPLHVLALLVEGLVFSVVKWDRKIFIEIYANSLLALWRQAPALGALRKTLQSKKAVDWKTYLSTMRWRHHKIYLLCAYGVPHIK